MQDNVFNDLGGWAGAPTTCHPPQKKVEINMFSMMLGVGQGAHRLPPPQKTMGIIMFSMILEVGPGPCHLPPVITMGKLSANPTLTLCRTLCQPCAKPLLPGFPWDGGVGYFPHPAKFLKTCDIFRFCGSGRKRLLPTNPK